MTSNVRTLQYCLSLLSLGLRRCRAMANLVMSLSSAPHLRSVVELSKNPFYHYTYSNITKVVHLWHCPAEALQKFFHQYVSAPRMLSNGQTFYGFIHDFTTLSKPASPTLAGRGFLPCNNPVAGKLGFTGGFHLSNLHYASGIKGHCPPLYMDRLDGAEDKLSKASAQIKSAYAAAPFQDPAHLNLLKLDSAYTHATLLSGLYEIDNSLIISRFRTGVKVWTMYEGPQKGKRPRQFGDTFHLIEQTQTCTRNHPKTKQPYSFTQHSILELRPDDLTQTTDTLGNGRTVIITTKRWNNMLMRSKGKATMQDKPFDVVKIEVHDAQTKGLVFKRSMFLCVFGKRKHQIPTKDIQPQYKERYDVEPSYRFAKQQLLLNDFQTPELKHLDNWIIMVQLSLWLLFVIGQEGEQIACEVWQKYYHQNKIDATQEAQKVQLTRSQAQRAAQNIFSTFEKDPFLPQSTKKGKGRQTGKRFKRRVLHRIKRKAELKQEKILKKEEDIPA